MALVAFLITFLCLWVGGSCAYNLFLHPLSHYPGPLICRASPISRIWHRLLGTAVQHVHQLHEKYGPVVRLSPGELSFITSDAWDDIYTRQGGSEVLPKERAYSAGAPDLPDGLFNVSDGPAHSRQRRIFAPAFTNTALRRQEAMILLHQRKLVSLLHRACERGQGGQGGQAEINLADFFNFLTFDIMADLAFGEPLGLLDAGAYSPWVQSVFAIIRVLSTRAVLLQYMPVLDRLLTPLLATKANVEKRSAHMGYAAGLVDKRLDRADELDRPDIWSLVEKTQDDSSLMRAEMHANAALFMAAGTETTATALCGIVWFLTQHPDSMANLVKEIRGLEGGEEAFTMETLAKLPYLNAVINESMRLYPSTPDMPYREVPEGGAVICGRHLVSGTVVGVQQYPAYHSSHNFHRAEEFLPERWLPEAAEKGDFVKDDRRVFNPFGKGPRSCIGKNLALHEIRLALAHVLRNFDLFAAKGSEKWITGQRNFLAWEKPPLPVVVKKVAA